VRERRERKGERCCWAGFGLKGGKGSARPERKKKKRREMGRRGGKLASGPSRERREKKRKRIKTNKKRGIYVLENKNKTIEIRINPRKFQEKF
jgi:hypothetical protein